MPSLYYKEEFEIGNGKRMGVLFIDSCLMLCSNRTQGKEKVPKDEETRSL